MTIPVGGPWDPEQHMVLVKPVSAWVKQANDAVAEIEAANGGQPVPTLDAAYEIAPKAFSSLIEALVALAPVSGLGMPEPALIRKAGLVPVDQALMEGE